MLLNRFFCCFIALCLLAACNKDEELTIDPNAKLSFSADSILFDTVFTSIGSTTRRLKIKNTNANRININSIKLAGGNNSAFSLNINGQAGNSLQDLKLNGNDSIYIFIKVNINPNSKSLPFIVQDSILLEYNAIKTNIPLVAYGQNAIFLNNATISANTTWNSQLPYVIYKSATISENSHLTIEEGTRVFFNGKATLNIKGTLSVKGSKTDSVVFASDRLEQMYLNESGQWNGIHFFAESSNSSINYAVIKNAIVGITVDSLSKNDQPKLLLTNSVVKNMEVVGFLGYQTELTAFNNLFYNCGQYLVYGAGGGNYNLKQNTFAGYNLNFNRKTPSVYLSDNVSSTQNANLSVTLTNNIFWGWLNNELVIEKKAIATVLTANIQNNLIKTTQLSYQGNGNLINTDPQFINPSLGNFKLSNSSAAKNKGMDLTTDRFFTRFLRADLENKSRLFPSELGCYENN
jgi:hypothetical protein